MDNHSAPLWPPSAPSAPYDFPPIRVGAARSAVARTFPRDVNTLGGDNGLLLAAGEGLLSLAPSLDRIVGSSFGKQHSGIVAGTGYAMQGVALAGTQAAPPLQARQPSLPMPFLGPQAEPPMPGWVSPVEAASYAGYPVRDRRSSHLHDQERGLSMDANASGPFAHLVAVARGHLGDMDARLGSIPLPVTRTATAFSFDWKGGAQQQEQQLQRGQATWPDQGRHQQEQLLHHQQSQDRLTPGSMSGGGFVGGDRNLFASPSWTPEFHTSFAASMITPEFSPSAWDDGGGGMQRGTSSDGDAVTSMASISPYTSESPPNEQDGRSGLPDTIDASQDREAQTMLGVSSSQPVDAMQAQWLSASALVPNPIDLFTTPEEKERQAEASLDIASRTTVDEELLWSLTRPMELNPTAREPPSLQPASTPLYPAKASHPLPTPVAPSKTVVVPGLSLNTAPQYRRMCLADILNDSDSRDNGNSRRRPNKSRKQGTGQKQQSARKPKFSALVVASKRAETVATSKKRLLSKPDASSVVMRPTSRLSPAFGRVGNATARTSLSANPALQPVIPRTQPSIPPVRTQRRPRGGAKPQRAKSAAAALKREKIVVPAVPQSMRNKGNAASPAQRAPTSFSDPAPVPLHSSTAATQCASGPSAVVPFSLQPCRATGSPVRVEASSRPGTTTKKRRRNETSQTQRMKLAAQMMQEALRGVGAGDDGSNVHGSPQQRQVQELSGPAFLPGNLTSGESSVGRLNNGCEAASAPTGRLNVHTGAVIAPGASLGLLSAVKQGFGATGETVVHSQSAPSLGSVQVPGVGLADTFDLGAVTAEPPPTAVNSTVVVFCKRDFMRYQAAKLWRKYQEQQQKQEWRPVRVEGKRTRFRNPKYDMLVHKVRVGVCCFLTVDDGAGLIRRWPLGSF